MRRLLLIVGLLVAGVANVTAQDSKPIFYFNPDWSADGKKIVFESTKDGKFALYVIQPDGSNLRKLTGGEANDEQPRWSRDGRHIVFISDRDGHLQLYVMNADGSQQRRLTRADDLDYLPEFSPKGDQVAFMSRPERASVVHDIYVIRTDGTGRTKLTSDQNTNSASPRWSPDGKRILFTRSAVIKRNYRDMSGEERARMRNSAEIFVMNRDGSEVRNLTNNQAHEGNPQWSKNGKTIYFLSEREGAPHIYAMNADGTNVRKIADGSVVADPNVSGDGKHFAYTKQVNGKWAVYIYEIKSGKERLLTGG